MTPKKTVERNREILAAFEAGISAEGLARQYGLSDQHVRAVLTNERNKRIFSPEPFYRALRGIAPLHGHGSKDRQENTTEIRAP
jgi:hypothetical protein